MLSYSGPYLAHLLLLGRAGGILRPPLGTRWPLSVTDYVTAWQPVWRGFLCIFNFRNSYISVINTRDSLPAVNPRELLTLTHHSLPVHAAGTWWVSQRSICNTRYNWSSLAYRDRSNKYMLAVGNKFDTLQGISERHSPNDEHENFFTAYIGAVTKCIPTESRVKRRVPCESLEVRKIRDNIFSKASKLKKYQRTETYKKPQK